MNHASYVHWSGLGGAAGRAGESMFEVSRAIPRRHASLARRANARGLVHGADRILVTGAPGSGKSTASHRLAGPAGRTLVELDSVIGELAEGGAAADGALDVLVTSERWVCDGTYADSMDGRMELADLVVLLDLPATTCAWRAIRRRRRSGKSVMSIAFFRMLAYTMRFRLGIRGRIIRSAGAHGVPLVRVRSARAASDLLRAEHADYRASTR